MMTPKQKQLFDYLCGKHAGDMVTEQEILIKTGWALTTLNTYRSKNYIDPFLAHNGGGQYRVLQNGNEISEQDVVRAFTQVKHGIFTPMAGMKLEGACGVYELKAKLGNGAVAHVWRCVTKATSALMAAKVMNPNQDLLNPKVIGNVRQRFMREAKHGKQLSHPNLIKYRDYGEVEGQPFIIMDLAERSLADILMNSPLTLTDSLEVLRSCLLGLQYLHGLNCEHRDVKPANILQLGSQFVLGDLGIVSWSDMNPAFTSAATITRDSLQLGSWYYMSPEQRRQPHQVTPASDIYAMGVSWYEMLTQVTPDPADVAAQYFPPATTDSKANELIKRMMSFKPTDRPSVSELLEKIESIRMENLPSGQLL
jgi:serine/threonine-protein kinase